MEVIIKNIDGDQKTSEVLVFREPSKRIKQVYNSHFKLVVDNIRVSEKAAEIAKTCQALELLYIDTLAKLIFETARGELVTEKNQEKICHKDIAGRYSEIASGFIDSFQNDIAHLGSIYIKRAKEKG